MRCPIAKCSRVHHQIVALYRKVAECNVWFRRPHRLSSQIPAPISGAREVDTDQAFCALAIKAASTKDSIYLLCEAGHGESALALSRVLFENAVLMAWQRLGPGRQRLETYILFASAQHEHWADTVLHLDPQSTPRSDPYHAAVTEAVFQGYDDTWAYFPNPQRPDKLQKVGMRTMLRDLPGNERPFEYQGLYRLGCDHVHTSPYSLGYLLAPVAARRMFFLEPLHASDSRVAALAVSNSSMLIVLDVMDEYVGLGIAADVKKLVDLAQPSNNVAATAPGTP